MLPDNENRSRDQHTPVSDEIGQAASEHNQPQQTLGQPAGPASIVLESPIPGYRLKPEIAQGGMGIVYSAECLTFGREVAIKVMKAGMSAAVFNREAQITARLPHPGIPPVHALGTLPDGRPYLVMKLIKGETLDSILKNRSDFSLDRGKLVAVFEHICQAVGFAHAQGIIHRDLKPSNVMVGAFGEVQVMDWGLAREVKGAEEIEPETVVTDQSLTMAGQIKGTPAYMAPEQARGEELDARADVFALGGMLAAILTGRPPFSGNSVMETIARAVKCDLGETLSMLNVSGADPELLALCRRCLEARREDRPADGTELANKISLYQAEIENKARHKLEMYEYGATMRVAHYEWREANIQIMRTLLDSTDYRHRGWEWNYLNRLCDASILTLFGHTSCINYASFSLDGKRILTVDNLTARVWDTKTGTELLVLKNSPTEGRPDVFNASFSPNGKQILTVGDNAACVLDAITGAKLLALKGHINNVKNAWFSPDSKRIYTSEVNTVCVWDAITGAELLALKGHTKAAWAVSFNRDGTLIVMLSWADKIARVWDALTGAELLALKGHTNQVWAASFSSDGRRILTAGDSTARVWDAKTGAELLVLKGHTGPVNNASFSPDGARIVTASRDKTARVWDSKTGVELRVLNGHKSDVMTAVFGSDGRRILTAGDTTARIWDTETGVELIALKGHMDIVTAASFSSDGSRIVTWSHDCSARVWDAEICSEKLDLIDSADIRAWETVCDVKLSPDNSGVLARFTGGKHIVWSAITGGKLLAVNGGDRFVVTKFSPNGMLILTCAEDMTIKILDAKNSQEICILKGLKEQLRCASFSPDSTLIVTASNDNTVRLWDAKTGEELFSLKGFTEELKCALFSPDSMQILTASDDNTVRLLDAKTGERLLALNGHLDCVYSAAFSPDGTQILTASNDNTARLWNAKTGEGLMVFTGHLGNVHAASFSPDGKQIVTTCSDDTVRVWATTTSVELLTLKKIKGLNNASFSPDGRRILTTASDSVQLWDAKTGAELMTIKGRGGVAAASFSVDGTRIVWSDLNITHVFDSRPMSVTVAEREAALAKSTNNHPLAFHQPVIAAGRDTALKVTKHQWKFWWPFG